MADGDKFRALIGKVIRGDKGKIIDSIYIDKSIRNRIYISNCWQLITNSCHMASICRESKRSNSLSKNINGEGFLSLKRCPHYSG